jgi:hypothetical protein
MTRNEGRGWPPSESKSPAMMGVMAGQRGVITRGNEDRIGNYRTLIFGATGELGVRHG